MKATILYKDGTSTDKEGVIWNTNSVDETPTIPQVDNGVLILNYLSGQDLKASIIPLTDVLEVQFSD
jgi:hypothetical protein